MNVYAIKIGFTTYTRVAAGTTGAVRLPVWTGGNCRSPRMCETFDTFRDGSTLYAYCYC